MAEPGETKKTPDRIPSFDDMLAEDLAELRAAAKPATSPDATPPPADTVGTIEPLAPPASGPDARDTSRGEPPIVTVEPEDDPFASSPTSAAAGRATWESEREDAIRRAREILGKIENRRFEAWTMPENLRDRLGDHFPQLIRRALNAERDGEPREIINPLNSDPVFSRETRISGADVENLEARIREFVTEEAVKRAEAELAAQHAPTGSKKKRALIGAAKFAGAAGASVFAGMTFGLGGLAAVAGLRAVQAVHTGVQKRNRVKEKVEELTQLLTDPAKRAEAEASGLLDHLLLGMSEELRRSFREGDAPTELKKAREQYGKTIAHEKRDSKTRQQYEWQRDEMLRNRINEVHRVLGDRPQDFGLEDVDDSVMSNVASAMEKLIYMDEGNALSEVELEEAMHSTGWMTKIGRGLDAIATTRKSYRGAYIGAMFVGGAVLREVGLGRVMSGIGGMVMGEAAYERWGKKEKTHATVQSLDAAIQSISGKIEDLKNSPLTDELVTNIEQLLRNQKVLVQEGLESRNPEVRRRALLLENHIAQAYDVLVCEKSISYYDYGFVDPRGDFGSLLADYRKEKKKEAKKKMVFRAAGAAAGVLLGAGLHEVAQKVQAELDAEEQAGGGTSAGTGADLATGETPADSTTGLKDVGRKLKAIVTFDQARDLPVDEVHKGGASGDQPAEAESDDGSGDSSSDADDAPPKTSEGPAAPLEPSSTPDTAEPGSPTGGISQEQLDLAVVHRSQGVEHVLQRQLVQDPKAFGYAGDVSDPAQVKEWAGGEAHRLAIENHYVENGEEVRVRPIDKIAYVLNKDRSITEVQVEKSGSHFVEVSGTRQPGQVSDLDKYEYKKPLGTVEVRAGSGSHRSVVDEALDKLTKEPPAPLSMRPLGSSEPYQAFPGFYQELDQHLDAYQQAVDSGDARELADAKDALADFRSENAHYVNTVPVTDEHRAAIEKLDDLSREVYVDRARDLGPLTADVLRDHDEQIAEDLKSISQTIMPEERDAATFVRSLTDSDRGDNRLNFDRLRPLLDSEGRLSLDALRHRVDDFYHEASASQDLPPDRDYDWHARHLYVDSDRPETVIIRRQSNGDFTMYAGSIRGMVPADSPLSSFRGGGEVSNVHGDVLKDFFRPVEERGASVLGDDELITPTEGTDEGTESDAYPTAAVRPPGETSGSSENPEPSAQSLESERVEAPDESDVEEEPDEPTRASTAPTKTSPAPTDDQPVSSTPARPVNPPAAVEAGAEVSSPQVERWEKYLDRTDPDTRRILDGGLELYQKGQEFLPSSSRQLNVESLEDFAQLKRLDLVQFERQIEAMKQALRATGDTSAEDVEIQRNLLDALKQAVHQNLVQS